MMLKVYADESGTHDGADVLALSGIIDSKGHWDKFRLKWKAVLKKYGAENFHYRKFRRIANTNQGDPYYGWSDEKRTDFLFDLAMLVGESAVPTGGSYHFEENKKKGLTDNPIESTIWAFYKSTLIYLIRIGRNIGGAFCLFLMIVQTKDGRPKCMKFTT